MEDIEDLTYEGERNQKLHNKLLYKDKNIKNERSICKEYKKKMKMNHLNKKTNLS